MWGRACGMRRFRGRGRKVGNWRRATAAGIYFGRKVGDTWAGRLRGLTVEEGLLELAVEDVALGGAQAVHEEDAVQVVQLVLEDAGEEVLSLDLDGALVAVQAAHEDPASLPNLLAEVRDEEAPLLGDYLALLLDQLGVDQDQELSRIAVL